jgi:hypothetical protein
MLTSTGFNVPNLSDKQARLIFWISGLFFLCTSVVSVYTNTPVLLLLPFALLFVVLTGINFRTIFFGMLVLLPLSVESILGDFGLDLPSEPMVMLLAGFAILYFIWNRDELKRLPYRHPIFIIIIMANASATSIM